MKKSILFIVCIYLINPLVIFAHSGRTNSSGCHNCYTGSCAGEYHCHNGGSVSNNNYVPFVDTTPENPINKASVEVTQSSEAPYFNVLFSYDNPKSIPISVSINRTRGSDPGPNTDTHRSNINFNKITSGKWYVNMKSGVGNEWSKILSWEVDVPKYIYPTITPRPTVTPKPTITPTPSLIPTPTNSPPPSPTPDPSTLEGAKMTLGITPNLNFFERSLLFIKLLFK